MHGGLSSCLQEEVNENCMVKVDAWIQAQDVDWQFTCDHQAVDNSDNDGECIESPTEKPPSART